MQSSARSSGAESLDKIKPRVRPFEGLRRIAKKDCESITKESQKSRVQEERRIAWCRRASRRWADMSCHWLAAGTLSQLEREQPVAQLATTLF